MNAGWWEIIRLHYTITKCVGMLYVTHHPMTLIIMITRRITKSESGIIVRGWHPCYNSLGHYSGSQERTTVALRF